MKAKLLITFLFLIITSTQVLAQRPAIGGLDQKLDTLVNALVVCPPGAPTRFVDNGDGTICDHQTGLMWERKDAADGTQDLHNPHDVDNRYSWSSSGTVPDGTAFTDFLARLNGEAEGERTDVKPSEQLPGYTDWRLPTSAELQTIRDCSFGNPCIDPIFGPTAAQNHWSSTSFVDPREPRDAEIAWIVDFLIGGVSRVGKTSSIWVRAVRGGR